MTSLIMVTRWCNRCIRCWWRMSTCTGWLRVSLKLCNVGCMILAFVCGCLAGCYCQLTYECCLWAWGGTVNRYRDSWVCAGSNYNQRNVVCPVTWLPHGSLSKQSWIYCVVLKRTVLNSRTLESYWVIVLTNPFYFLYKFCWINILSGGMISFFVQPAVEFWRDVVFMTARQVCFPGCPPAAFVWLACDNTSSGALHVIRHMSR